MIVHRSRCRLPRGPAERTATSGELAESLSHDIRGRLRGVAGFLDIATDQLADDAADHALVYLERAAAAGRTADRMLERLVRLLRLDETTFHVEPTPLDQLVIDAAAAAGEGIAVRAEGLPVVLADGPLLSEVLVELFQNAREFTRDDEPPRSPSAHVRRAGGAN